jgi:dTDP-4-dehydrorhamnose reductase
VCAARDIQLLTFSSDLVFDGSQRSPYLESHAVKPLNNYGRSKEEAERRVQEACPEALVVRTSAFFGPWDNYNFVTLAMKALGQGQRFPVSTDITVSPTYVPDLVHASLDLLIDKAAGIWHLTNGHPLTWAELALMAAEKAGIDGSWLEPRTSNELGHIAVRPPYSALSSERGSILPTLHDALDRYVAAKRHELTAKCPEKMINTRK